MVQIRPYTNRDAHAVSQVIRTTMRISNTADYPPSKIQPLIDYFSPQKVDLLNQARICLVAECTPAARDNTDTDGAIELVGTIGLEEGELVTFFVLPDYQGRGIGRMLLGAIEKLATAQGVKTLRVASSLTAERFYTRHGYRRCAQPFEGTAGLQIPMRKTLNATGIQA